MRNFLTAYARAVGALGLVLLVAALATDHHWRHEPLAMLVLAAVVFFVRINQIPLTKYGALNLLMIPAITGALLAGPAASALALWIGVLAADALHLKKGLEIGWINAGREVAALIASFGVYAWISTLLNVESMRLSAESLLPISLLLSHISWQAAACSTSRCCCATSSSTRRSR